MNSLNAFFYLHEAELPPPDAPDAWFMGKDDISGLTERVALFREHALLLADELTSVSTEEEFQFLFYERAKSAFGTDGGSIREFFRMLYLVVLGQPSGPRWGQFVVMMGRDAFISLLRRNLSSPLRF